MKTTTPLDLSEIIDQINDFSPLSPETLAALTQLDDGDKIPRLVDAEGDDLENCGFEWSSIATQEWDDDCGEHIYQINDCIFAHIGNYERSIHTADSIQDFLSNWDCDSYGSPEALLVSFGITPTLDEAAEDYIGPCKVWISYNYFTNHCGAPQAAWLVEEDQNGPISRDPMIFDSYEDAQAWIKETEDSARGYKSETNPRGCYILSHGEASPPDYTICQA